MLKAKGIIVDIQQVGAEQSLQPAKKNNGIVGTAVAAGAGGVLGYGAYYVAGGGSKVGYAKQLLKGGVDKFVSRHTESDFSKGMYLGEKARKLKLPRDKVVGYTMDNLEKLPDILREDFKELTKVSKHSKGKIAAFVAAGAAVVGGICFLIKNFKNKKAEAATVETTQG